MWLRGGASQDCNHDFDKDRAILAAIRADEKESEQEFAAIMDRVERWNRVHNKPPVPARRGDGGAPGGGHAPSRSYDSLPAGYDGRQVSPSHRPPAYPPSPAGSAGGAPPAYPSQPPPSYYGGVGGAGGGRPPPAYSPGGYSSGSGGAPPPYNAAVSNSGSWTCHNCTYQVQPSESSTTCPVCASPRR